jgi:hypothetical protein
MPDIDAPKLLEEHRSWPRHAGMYFSGRIGDKLRVQHNFELSPLLHPTTEAIVGVMVGMQGANWNFIIDQGATEAFARDRTQHYRPSALVFRFPAMTHQIEFSWDDYYEHRPIILTADEAPLTGTPEEVR